LLRALPDIRARVPGTKLLVVGEFYEPRAGIDKLVQELGLTDAVVIRDDYCPNEKVGMYFAAADAVVLPYRSATQSGIIQVAYALGLPVITTDVGGLGEVVIDGETGFIVPPGDNAALVGAVERFYQRGGRAAFAGGVGAACKRFGWDGMLDTIESFARRAREARRR
jgi:glycosyltransferase involved in cell wall biosynthesis